MAWSVAQQLRLRARPIRFAASVRLDPEYFGEKTTLLKSPIGTEVGNYRLESAVQKA